MGIICTDVPTIRAETEALEDLPLHVYVQSLTGGTYSSRATILELLSQY